MTNISELLITPAHAETELSPSLPAVTTATVGATSVAPEAAAPGGRDMLVSVIPFVLIALIIYFFMIRPQQKSMLARNEMLRGIRKGDKIVTGGGLAGVVTKVDGDDWLVVEIADGVTVRALRSTVTGAADAVAKPEAPKSKADK